MKSTLHGRRAPAFPLAVVATGLALAASAQARVWTDVQGREVEADYVSHDRTELVMRLEDGRNATVPLSRLSEADREYIESGMAEAGGDDEGDGNGEDQAEEETGELNWDDPWPDEIKFEGDPDIEVVEENEEKDRYIYTSENYRFTCDARLSTSVVSTFADMFEATRLFCRQMPLAITGGVKKDGKYDILLFETKESYIEAGGPPGSAGVFIGGRNIVMVPLVSLGLQQVGSGYMRDRDKNDTTLVHELVHQLTPGVYYREGSRGWFTEGIAEYCANSPYRSGRFKVRSNQDEIEEAVVAYGEDGKGGRGLGDEIRAPRLKEFMMMPYSHFTGGNANFNYGFATLIVTYFCHFDGEGEAARLRAFLQAMRANPDDPEAAFDALLDGRTWAEMEKDLSDGWSIKGVDIEFPEWEEE